MIKHKLPEEFPFLKPLKQIELNWFQKWILNRKFVRITIREAEIQAFPKALEDLKETNLYDTDTKANELADKKLNDMLSNVDLRHIVSLDKQHGIIYIGGEKADNARLTNLKSEAEAMESFELWNLLQETPKELAQRGMFIDGKSLDDMQKGKSILYTLSTQKNIINILKSYKPK